MILRPHAVRFLSLFTLLIVFALLLSMGVLVQDVSASGTIWYVSETGSDSNDCLSIATACASIQYTINNKAAHGDDIYVGPSTYYELVVMKTGVDVISSAGPSSTTIAGLGYAVWFNGVSSSELRGFTLTTDPSWSDWDRGAGALFDGILTTTAVLRNNVIMGTHDAVVITSGSPLIENNTIAGTDVGRGPGVNGIFIDQAEPASPVIRNNIITGYQLAGINVAFGVATPTIEYNNVWGNALNYRDYPDQTGINGNISANPLYEDPANGDFRLHNCSPSIDAADPSDHYYDEPMPNGDRRNMGAYGHTSGATTSDCDWYVGSSGNDMNSCAWEVAACRTIDEVISRAKDGDVVHIGSGTWDYAGNTMYVDKSLSFIGAGADQTIIAGNDSANLVYIYSASGALDVSLSDMTLRDGASGLVTSVDTTLNLARMRFTSHSGNGAIDSRGVLTIEDCTFDQNSRGILSSNSAITITGTTFNDNGPAAGGGGAIVQESGGTLNITNSTFHGNESSVYGGAIQVDAGSMTLTNVTIADNAAQLSGGGIFYHDSATVQIRNVLLDNNLRLSDSQVENCAGPGMLISNGNNMENGNSCGFSLPGDFPNTDPLLGLLQDNGGSTYTQALLGGSPAIDAGSSTGCPATDQRGIVRPVGVTCDIGAYESTDVPTVDDRYVSETGSDGANCLSWATACRTVSGALGKITAGNTIYVAAGTYPDNIVIDKDVTIQGTEQSTTLIDGNQAGRVVTIDGAYTVTINDLTLTNGKLIVGQGQGAGIYNDGTLTLTQVGVTSNRSWDKGGGIYNAPGGDLTLENCNILNNYASGSGGGISNQGLLDVHGSVFSGNEANAGGGGIANEATATVANTVLTGRSDFRGAAVYNIAGDITLTNTLVKSNSASSGGQGGGIFALAGTVTVIDSYIISNWGSNGGGGVYVDAGATVNISQTLLYDNYSGRSGAGIYNAGSLSVTNSTLYNNRVSSTDLAYRGAGIHNVSGGTTSLTNVTLWNNKIFTPWGDYIGDNLRNEGSLTLQNTIVGFSLNGTGALNCFGAVTSNGHNLASDGTCGLAGTGDVSGVAPNLTAIPTKSGSIYTSTNWAFLPDQPGPALDGGDNAGCPAVDQRGEARPVDGNSDSVATCDIGAVEVTEAERPDLTPPTNPGWLSSPSHTVNVEYTDNNTVSISWATDASDSENQVAGYSVLWDNSASTQPDTTVEYDASTFAATPMTLNNGSWYFHLSTCDDQGNCSDAMHLGPFIFNLQELYVAVGGDDANSCTIVGDPCATLDGALAKAQNGMTVYIDGGVYMDTAATVAVDVNIVGSGTGSTILDGNYGGVSVIQIASSTTVQIADLTIRHGRSDVTASSGGIHNEGDLSLDNVEIYGNSATQPYSSGGGFYNSGTASLDNVFLHDNHCTPSYGGCNGGGIYNNGVLSITNSLITGNYSGYAGSYDINNYGGTVTIENSTVSLPAGGQDGGVLNAGGSMQITHATLFGRSTGGSVLVNASGSMEMKNSIVYVNNAGWDCYGTITSLGYNIASDDTCGLDQPTDLPNTDALLNTLLRENAGVTKTHALLEGSPAIDAIPPENCGTTQDQRGVSRPQNINCDVGAFEAASFCALVTEIPQQECDTLIGLYDSTEGDTWTDNTGWLQTVTPCSWYGVTCDAGQVTRLELGSNNLTGAIPAELGSLGALRYLDLTFNQLSGSIPSQLGGLTSLEYLYLSFNNNLNGTIPPALGDLSNLQVLDLARNTLSGSIPPQLGNLSNLRELSLWANQLSGSIPVELGGLTNLEHLNLDFNILDGDIPPELGNLSALIALTIEFNSLSGSIPASLNNLTNLTHLYLFNNKLSGVIPDLSALTGLVEFDVHNNQLSGDIPAWLASLNAIASLDVGYNALTAADPALVAYLNVKDSDWATTQTVPPTELAGANDTPISVDLTWEPILYTADGGYYEVSYATDPGGPWTVIGQTDDKMADRYSVAGLIPNVPYYFRVRTHTPAHAGGQQNDLWSDYSEVLLYNPSWVIINEQEVFAELEQQIEDADGQIAFVLADCVPDGLRLNVLLHDGTSGEVQVSVVDSGSGYITIQINAVTSGGQPAPDALVGVVYAELPALLIDSLTALLTQELGADADLTHMAVLDTGIYAQGVESD